MLEWDQHASATHSVNFSISHNIWTSAIISISVIIGLYDIQQLMHNSFLTMITSLSIYSAANSLYILLVVYNRLLQYDTCLDFSALMKLYPLLLLILLPIVLPILKLLVV